MTNSEDQPVAIVAGGGGDIGRAIAARLAQRGYSVALFDRDAAGLDEAIQLAGSDHAKAYQLDLTDDGAVERAVADVVEHWHAPSLLVTSVGNLGPHAPAAWEIGAADWSKVIGVNLFAPINLVRAAMPYLEQRAQPARIVMIASLMGLIPDSRVVAYTAAKHALVSYAESLRGQLLARELPISVTLACPGGVATQLNADMRAATGQAAPADWPTPDELAELLVDSLDGSDQYVFSHGDSREKLQAYYDEVLATARF